MLLKILAFFCEIHCGQRRQIGLKPSAHLLKASKSRNLNQ